MKLDGRVIASEIRDNISKQAEKLKEEATVPTLSIVVATEDDAALQYVGTIQSTAKKCGVSVRLVSLSPEATTDDVKKALKKEADDTSVHGLILQTPLPEDVFADELLSLIPVEKDVDGANPLSAGYLEYGLPTFVPATAAAVMKMLDYYKVPIDGKLAVVIGRSKVVGKPVAQLLLKENATVTICHSHTSDLTHVAQQADILVVAAGKPEFIIADDVKAGAVVIDVGTNITTDDRLVGDVNPLVGDKADLSPVPGGIGPITTALILQHTLMAASGLRAANSK